MKSAEEHAGKNAPSFPPRAQLVAQVGDFNERSMQMGRSRASWLAGVARGGFDLRARPFLSFFAASLIAFAPVQVMAQEANTESSSVRDRPRDEYDPLGLRFGGFNLDATLDLGVTSTDNLRAQELNPIEDVFYAVAPTARLQSGWSRHALVIEGGARFLSHQDTSNEDVDTNFLRGTGRVDIGSRSNVSLTAGIAHEVEPRTNPDAPTSGDPVEYDRTDLAVSASHQFNRLRVTGSLGTRQFEYDNQAFRDNEQTSVRGRLDAELTPRVGLVLEATTDQREYENNPALDSDGQTILAGVSINFTDLVRGEVTAGQFSRDYDSGADVDGTAIAANVEWYVSGLTTVTLNARRNAEDVGGTVSQPYTETQYGARVDHEVLRNVILTAGVNSGRREYEVIDREDEFVSADVGADYFMNRRVALRARYTFDDVESTGVNRYRDFDANAFTVGLSLRL